MKLLRCHIENFGKLSNFNHDFEEGLEIIKKENGFGKTTFADFIKAMFYGMSAKRSTKVLIDRKKYEPWQGGAFGGNIEFEIDGKKYKIERFFGQKESEDTFKLIDLSTNLESKAYSKNIGEEIFKINKEAYERSTFISGQKIVTAMNDSISAKLGNVLENENDVNTSDQAIKMLDTAIKNYKKTGDRGEINEKIAKKTIIEKKIEQSKINEKILQERKEKYNNIKLSLKEKEKEREKLNGLLNERSKQEANRAKLENYNLVLANLTESKNKLNVLNDFFKGEVPSDIEIETLIDKCMLVEKYKVEVKNCEISLTDSEDIESLKSVFQDKEISENDINEKISEYNSINDIENKITINEEKKNTLADEIKNTNTKKKKDKNIGITLLVCTIIAVVIGIVMFLNQSMQIAIIAIVIGIFSGIISLVKINGFKKDEKRLEEKENELSEIEEVIANLQDKEIKQVRSVQEFIDEFSENQQNDDRIFQLTEIKTRFMKFKDLTDSINGAFEKQQEIMTKLNELEDSIKSYLLKYFNEITQSYVTYAQEMKIKKSELEKQQEDYKIKETAKEDYETANDVSKIKESQNSEIEKVDKNEIERKISEKLEKINKLNDEKNYNKNQIELLESNLDTVFDLENELEQINQEITEMKKKCEILEKTKKYLETAKEQFSSHYLNRMENSFYQNLKYINGEELDINLDVNLNVNINEQGKSREINYLSAGYKDLIYICMRLALIDSLFEGEKPFIILDDPFINLDEEKIKNAMNLLRQLSNNYQIIYFICHDSRK